MYLITAISVLNAIYTFTRRRHYRLFESSIDAPQSTPSARRVRVDSSPVSSSPLRLLTNLLGSESAESRAHPDPTRDVWEIAVWDPLPVCLRLFCLFSPGHVLVYWLFLPTVASDPRPSVTVFTTILLELLMSSQLYLLQTNFSQQEKDTAIISKEVMSEYDTKFVHPRTNPVARDVGTQFTGPDQEQENYLQLYTPTVIIKREYRTNPNPNYAKHIDPEHTTNISRQIATTQYTPSAYGNREPTSFGGITPRPPPKQPQFRQSVGGAVALSTENRKSDGGSLGIYKHANSPLKKATSMYDMGVNRGTPKNGFGMAAREIAEQRERERSRSPAKRISEAPRGILDRVKVDDQGDRRSSAPSSGFGNVRGGDAYQRFPGRY